jgi:hypothetical protein
MHFILMYICSIGYNYDLLIGINKRNAQNHYLKIIGGQ